MLFIVIHFTASPRGKMIMSPVDSLPRTRETSCTSLHVFKGPISISVHSCLHVLPFLIYTKQTRLFWYLTSAVVLALASQQYWPGLNPGIGIYVMVCSQQVRQMGFLEAVQFHPTVRARKCPCIFQWEIFDVLLPVFTSVLTEPLLYYSNQLS